MVINYLLTAPALRRPIIVVKSRLEVGARRDVHVLLMDVRQRLLDDFQEPFLDIQVILRRSLKVAHVSVLFAIVLDSLPIDCALGLFIAPRGRPCFRKR